MRKFAGNNSNTHNESIQVFKITQFQTLFLWTVHFSGGNLDAKDSGQLAGLPPHWFCDVIGNCSLCKPDPFAITLAIRR